MKYILPLLMFLSACSYAYTPPQNGEWVGDEAKLKADTEECHKQAENYIEDIGYGRGFGGNRMAHAKMKRCMTEKGYVWVKQPSSK